MKKRLTGATFDASAQTVVHASFSDVTLAGIQLIVNVTDQIIIYNFADSSVGGTLSTDTLTLEYDTTSMSDTDELMILVEDGVDSMAIDDGGNTITVDGTVTAELSAVDNAVLDTIDAVLDTINAKLVTGTDIGDVTINNSTGASAVNIQDGGNTITVDGTVAVSGTVTVDSELPSAVALADNLANPTVPGVGAYLLGWDGSQWVRLLTPASGADDVSEWDKGIQANSRLYGYDGTAWDRIRGTSADGLLVNLGTNNDVSLNAGTNAIGKLLAPDIDVTAHTNYAKKFYTSTGAATDGVVWSPAAGKRWHAVVIHFQVSADCTVTLEDDKAGGDEVVWKGEYKAGSGHTLTFSEKYPLASGEDAADLLITTSAGNIYLLAVGYEI